MMEPKAWAAWPRVVVSLLWIVVAAAAQSCAAESYVVSADSEVAEILDQRMARVIGARATTLVYPKAEPAAKDEHRSRAESRGSAQRGLQPGREGEAKKLDLARALKIAVEKNRGFHTRREQLYLQGLSYSMARFRFGPQLAATVGLVWGDAKASRESLTGNVDGSVSQILPTGLTSTRAPGGAPQRSYSSNAGVSLSQPLLRGAGYEASHEGLTSAERSLIYGIRSFVLFRETFSIETAQAFFGLISQKRSLAIGERSYDQAVFDRKKAEAMYQVDRNTETEVFRARRREIETENALIAQRAAYETQLDNFKIRLGLPTADPIEIVPPEPEVVPVSINLESAVTAAKNNRLDIRTQRDQVEDAERALRIARNGLLPDLRLTASYRLSEQNDALRGALPDNWATSAGLSMQLPIQQKPERNAYRSALISLQQARRAYTLTLDNLELSIRDQLRTLQSLEKQIELQRAQSEQEKRAVTVTQIRYEAGDLDNRDLLEARQGLIDVENSLIRLEVSHFIGRLNLMRALGTLSVDDNGMWTGKLSDGDESR